MTENERILLWAVEDVTTLSPEMKIVRNKNTGQLMLKRIYPADTLGLMRTLSEIRHPNLMGIYDAQLIGNICVTLGEYVEGATLEQAMEANGVYSEKDASSIIACVCSGLTALHSRGIIHRDINPSNVMIDRFGRVKVVDYDIARTVKVAQSRDTEVMGTAGYAAPEQFGFQQTDARADVYSCGVLLNFLLTGHLPNEQLYRGNLTPVIQKCIEMDADQRYVSAEHLRATLTNDKKYFRLHKNDDLESRDFRPPPGYRSRRVFPKILMTLVIIIYIFALTIHIIMLTQGIYQGDYNSGYVRMHIMVMFIVYGCWTLFPYLLFGDVGRYTKLMTKDIRSRKTISRVFGWMSILLGIVLFFVMLGLYNNGFFK